MVDHNLAGLKLPSVGGKSPLYIHIYIYTRIYIYIYHIHMYTSMAYIMPHDMSIICSNYV